MLKYNKRLQSYCVTIATQLRNKLTENKFAEFFKNNFAHAAPLTFESTAAAAAVVVDI